MNSRKIPKWGNNAKPAPDSENKVFCMAPWTHTYISPQSERRLCCASREDHSFQKQYIDRTTDDASFDNASDPSKILKYYNPESLTEYWNGQYMRDIRVKLMRGEAIPQCDVCNNNILMEGASYRGWFTGNLFRHKIQEAFDSTDDNGYTTMEPISFDYRVSNTCNFKCRMCGEQLSSAWESEKRKHNLWTPKDQVFMIPEVNAKIQEFTNHVVDPELRDAISRGIVEEMYWVGGEPLTYDVHWWALDEMVRNGSAKNCHLRYNTNLSNIKHGDKTLYDYLPHFKNWNICASIDATGEIVEYIRTGINWKHWLENFKQGVNMPGGHEKMILDVTLTGPGMFGIKELFDLSIELDVRIETKITFAFHPDIMWTPLSWPREILNEVVDDILLYIKPRATQKQQTLIDNLESLKLTRSTHEEQWPTLAKTAAVSGKHWVELLESIRPGITMRDIYSRNKKLLEWWDNIGQ